MGGRIRRIRSRWQHRDRALPDFLVLGVQKGGTTSLFNYLAATPGVMAPAKKELHHFDRVSGDRYRERGSGWYRSNFPRRRDLDTAGAITGEATPTYILDPLAMTRILCDLPDSRWIVVLRDPVERALSQYSSRVSGGRQVTPLLEEIEWEIGRLRTGRPDQEWKKIGHHFLERGHFAEQLTRIGELRSDRPTLVLFSENLFARHDASFALLHDFLGLPDPQPERFPHTNATDHKDPIDPVVDALLQRHFTEVNAGLADLLESGNFLTIGSQDWPTWIQPTS